jgi:hypothetical protein
MLKNTLFLFAFLLSALGMSAQMTGVTQLEEQGSNQAGGCNGIVATFNLNVDNLVNTGNGDVIVQITALQGGALIESISMSNDMTMDYPVCVDPGCYRAKIVANGANTGFICTLSIPGQDPIEMTYNSQNISFGTDLCITGCMQTDACNYDPNANINDYSSCIFTQEGYDCEGNCLSDPVDIATLASLSPFQMSDAECGTFAQGTLQGIVDFDGVASTYELVQDMGNGQYSPIDDPVNYSIDNACLVQLGGGLTFTFNAENNTLESLAPEPFEVYYYGATCALGTSLAPTTVTGCMFELACNYNPEATEMDHTQCDFDSCRGCTYPDAENYVDTATIDDGSCIFGYCVSCMGDFNNDGSINSSDLMVFLGVFGGTCEEN